MMSGIFVSSFAFLARLSALVAALGLAATGLNAASDTEAVVLPQSSPWNLDYGEDRCRLIRFFGEGDNRVVLVMEQFGLSSHFELILAGKPLRRFRRHDNVSLQMGPGFEAFERKFQRGNLGEIEPALIFGSISPVHGALEADDDPDTDDIRMLEDNYHPAGTSLKDNGAAIQWIVVSDKNDTVRLVTGDMAKPFAALTQCTDNLIRSWDVDPEVAASVVTPPRFLNVMDVAPKIQRNYPKKAMYRGQSANIQLRLIIDESGAIEDCTRIDVTEAENFTNIACEVFLEDAKFEPARDAEGNPVRTYSMQRIRYVMGG